MSTPEIQKNTNPLQLYLDVSRIHIDLEFASKKRLLEFLAEQLTENEDLKQQKRIFQALIEREKLGSTSMGNGIAIPHGRCKHIETASLCIITLDKGLDYEGVDDTPTHLIFGLITPEDANEEHLNLLSQIAQLLRQDNLKNELLQCKNAEKLLQIVTSKLV